MKKLLLILLLLPCIIFGQINIFPWTNDFDNGVGLTNWTGDDGDWLIWSGPTWSNNTGPQADHTTGLGNYWYVEASSPNYPDMYFVSQTDTFDISQTPGQILSFWYHMYGDYMGELNTWIGDDNGWTKIDAISGDQDDEWHLKYIELDSLSITGNFTIAFEGITGASWSSDIAIDDIYIGDSYPVGCMDALALNYDSTATVDDGSCAYPPCGGFINSQAYQMCWGDQAAIQFEWEGDTAYSQCDVDVIHIGDENGWSLFFPGYWPAIDGWSGFAVAVGNGQMPPNWSVEHFAVLEYADGTFSDTIFYTPTPCITGCMDSTVASYNPWATIDDGSCGGTNCDPATEQQITMTIRLDNWPQETGWTMVTNSGAGVNTPSGTYTYNDIGVTYTYDFCVSSTAGFEFILTDTYGDGIMGNGTAGSAGEVVIYDCNGDTITYLTSGNWLDGNQNPVGVNFGNTAYSTPQNGITCAGPPPVLGCLDPAYQEFNPLANVSDSSCINLHVYGCTDDTMFNYNPNATIMDLVPVCDYTLIIEDDAADGWGNSYLGVVQGNNTWTYTMGPGFYSQSFPIDLETDKPVTVYYFEVPNAQNPDPSQTTFQTMQNSFLLINTYGDTLLSEGTNPFANNGQGALQGFSSPFWTIYSATPSCGNYCEPIVYGCMDTLAYNYNSLANTTDTCYYMPGCTNSSYLEYYTQGYVAGIDDGSCITEAIWGCTDTTAFNYDSIANIDNGGCVAVIFGCMQPLAFNYNPNANMDDGSCVPFIYGCTDPTMFNFNASANTDDGSCLPYVFGCTDSTMFNFNPLANADNNSCVPYIYGCTDPSMLNYNPDANTEDFSCTPYVYGCMDSTALNYDPLANTDNGSCIEVVEGCMDQSAYNYDVSANVHDSISCLFDAGCVTGAGNPYWLNDPCYAWVISVDDYCCENEWDEICQLTYNYCDSTWVGPILSRQIADIDIYPNPTKGKIYFSKFVNVVLYNISGQKLKTKKKVQEIDLSNMEEGLYLIELEYNENVFINKIIKR